MNSVREIAQRTRRGLFGNRAPARAWEAAVADFQDAREKLSRTALELESAPPPPENRANVAAWESMLASINRQMSVMDSTATGILACSNIANGVESFFPGFEGVSACGVLGLDNIAAPATIAMLRGMTGAAHAHVNRINAYLGKPDARDGLSGLGLFQAWEGAGGAIWEWMHPEQVQREFEAVGMPPPSVEEIQEAASERVLERASEGVTRAGQMVSSTFTGFTTIAIAGAIIAAVVFLGGRK